METSQRQTRCLSLWTPYGRTRRWAKFARRSARFLGRTRKSASRSKAPSSQTRMGNGCEFSSCSMKVVRSVGQSLRSRFATSKKTRGGRRYTPYAFNEHGAIMAATVLNSKRAVQMSVFVVRAFVRLREMLSANRQLAAKIDELDRRLGTHDDAIQELMDAIKELMIPEEKSRHKIGFQLPPA